MKGDSSLVKRGKLTLVYFHFELLINKYFFLDFLFVDKMASGGIVTVKSFIDM